MVNPRDPRTNPQAGDELRDTGIIRRVIRRDGNKLLIHNGRSAHWMRLDRWQEWCEKGMAVVMPELRIARAKKAAAASAKVRSAKAKA